MSKAVKAGDFFKESPQDFQQKAIGLASEYEAMLRSPAWGLLLEFWQVQQQGYLVALESADTYEEFLKAKADMQAIKKAQSAAVFLLDDIRAGLKLAPPSADGISPDESRG